MAIPNADGTVTHVPADSPLAFLVSPEGAQWIEANPDARVVPPGVIDAWLAGQPVPGAGVPGAAGAAPVVFTDSEGNPLTAAAAAARYGQLAPGQSMAEFAAEHGLTIATGFTAFADTSGDGDGQFVAEGQEPAVPQAGWDSEVVELFELNDSGSRPSGGLTKEQNGQWLNQSTLEDDHGFEFGSGGGVSSGVTFFQINENTIVADGTVKIGDGTARVRTTYTRNPDGTITSTSVLINYYQDDALGSGGAGSAPPTTFVSRDRSGYTIIRTDEGSTVYDSDGNYVGSLDAEGRDTDTPPGTPSSLSLAIYSVQQSASDGSTTSR